MLSPEDYTRQVSALRAVANKVLHDQAAAEDVVQQALLKSLDSDAPPTSMKSTVWRLSINFRRGEQRRRRREDVRRRARYKSPLSPQQHAEHVEVRGALAVAINKLPDTLRTVVLLRFYEELSISHIARVTGAGRAAVRRRLDAAYEYLRANLDSSYGDRHAWMLPLTGFVDDDAPSTGTGQSRFLLRTPPPKVLVVMSSVVIVVILTAQLMMSDAVPPNEHPNAHRVRPALVAEHCEEAADRPELPQSSARTTLCPSPARRLLSSLKPVASLAPRWRHQVLPGAFAPALDPDGNQILFTALDPRTDRSSVYCAPLGADARLVPRPLPQLNIGHDRETPTISPDGRTVAVIIAGGEAGPAYHIYLSAGDTRFPETLSRPEPIRAVNGRPDKSDHGVWICPNGALIFVSERTGSNDIYFAPLTARGFSPDAWGAPVRLHIRERTPGATTVFDPTLITMPGGRVLLFFSASTQPGKHQLWTSENRLGLEGIGIAEAWSYPTKVPGGTHVRRLVAAEHGVFTFEYHRSAERSIEVFYLAER